jgi:hypothetical protein
MIHHFEFSDAILRLERSQSYIGYYVNERLEKALKIVRENLIQLQLSQRSLITYIL